MLNALKNINPVSIANAYRNNMPEINGVVTLVGGALGIIKLVTDISTSASKARTWKMEVERRTKKDQDTN